MKNPIDIGSKTIDAANVHLIRELIRVLIEGIRLFTRQLKEAHRQLDRLCSLLVKPIRGETEQTGPEPEQTLVAIL